MLGDNGNGRDGAPGVHTDTDQPGPDRNENLCKQDDG